MSNQKGTGILILEFLITVLCTLIFLSAAIPSFLKVKAARQQTDAAIRVRMIGNSKAQLALCSMTVGCVSNPGVSAVIAAVSATTLPIVIEGYSTIWGNACGGDGGWCYSAIPGDQQGVYSFFIDSSNVLRCAPNAPSVSIATPACAF